MDNQRTKEYLKEQLGDYLASKGIQTSKQFHCMNPQHPDQNPSMSYNDKTKQVHCFSCGATYDIFDVIGLDYGLSEYKDQYEKACALYRVDPLVKSKIHTPKKEATQPKEDFTAYFGQVQAQVHQTDYFMQRGLSDKTVKAFGLGYDPHFSKNTGNTVWKSIIIPTSAHTFIARNTAKTATSKNRYRKIGEVQIFNLSALQNSTAPVFITEGELDALSIIEVGQTAIALGGVANCNKLLSYLKQNPPKCPLLLATDNDAAGKKATTQLKSRLETLQIPFAVVDITGQYKDPNEHLVQDKAGFEKAVINALSTPIIEPNTQKTVSKILGQYLVEDNSLWRITGGNGSEKKHLANFVPYPLKEITKDNGVTKELFFQIAGTLYNGQKLKEITVPAEQFDGMRWFTKEWGLLPTISVGNSNKDHVRNYIQAQATKIERQTIYTHTGFKEINGNLCYLYHGGVIGNDDIICNLDTQDLQRYTFDHSKQYTRQQAFDTEMELLQYASDRIGFSLFAFTYLAPLTYFMEKCGITPSFSLFCVGKTGSFKTTLSMMYLSHFMQYKGMGDAAPANFTSTENAIERKTFDLKDSLLLVDDYHPVNSSDKKRMDRIAQRIARGAGDHASRSRMNSDTSLKESYIPRGLTIITGEDRPGVDESGLARFYFVDVNSNELDIENLKKLGQKGIPQLNSGMYFYISWLIENKKEIENKIKPIFYDFVSKVKLTGQHGRTAPNIAALQVSALFFSQYAVDYHFFTLDEQKHFLDRCWNALTINAIHQIDETYSEKPAIKYLSTLYELISTNKKRLIDIDRYDCTINPDDAIGYKDDKAGIYYLFSNASYNAIKMFLNMGGDDINISNQRIYKDLQELGILLPDDKGKRTTVKKLKGTCVRVIQLSKQKMQEVLGVEQ